MSITGSSCDRLFFILGIVLVLVSCVTQSRKIDCTRFVFAPRCRGVAAKRADAMMVADNNDLQTTLHKDSDLLEDDWAEDDVESGLAAWQRLQYLADKLRQRTSYPNTMGDQDIWERLMAARAMRQ